RQRVAIKVLLPSVCDVPDTMKRFEREARAAVQLHGPNVARMIDVDATPEGLPFIVMEFLEGHDLSEEMERAGEIPCEVAVRYVLDVCAAMYEAHALGIIHRDLKPSNLFLCEDTEPKTLKVLDFGIVKLESGESTVTLAKTVLGTPAYMSPEQIRSATTVDGRTDIWSLGVILYELLTAELPFDGASAPAVSHAILMEAPKPLGPRRPDAPQGLIDVVMRALAKDMAERFPDVRSFAEALAPFGPTREPWSPPALSPRASSAPRTSRAERVAEAARASSSHPPRRRPGRRARRVRRARARGRRRRFATDATRATRATSSAARTSRPRPRRRAPPWPRRRRFAMRPG
ncbi:serine/threonine protein kinase, partial [bacterium]